MTDDTRLFQVKRTLLLAIPFLTTAVLLAWLLLSPLSTTQAAVNLTATPLTWDLVGLGPNVFPVGARACNTGSDPASNVVAMFVWLPGGDEDAINLSGPTNLSVPTLAAGACTDFYFNLSLVAGNVTITADRPYHIVVTADGGAQAMTPPNRAIFVEELNLEPNINAGTISGPITPTVGQTVEYVVQGASVPDLEQLEHFIDFPGNILRLKAVTARYAEPDVSNDKPYADACGWISDTTDPDYLNCSGTGAFTGTTTISGTLVTTYTVDVISTGTVTLTHVVYGYSEENVLFYYNTSASPLVITAGGQVTATVTPTVTGTPPTATIYPTATITPTATVTPTVNVSITNAVSPSEARVGQNLTFIVRVTNSSNITVTNTTITDTFSTFLDIVSANTTAGTATTNAATRQVNVTIGNLAPNATVTITIAARVNSSVTTTTNVNNSATLSYLVGGAPRSATSNVVTFRLLPASTLPGTGGMELDPPPQSPKAGAPFWLALLIGVLLGGLGLSALVYSLWVRERQPLWAGWFAKTGAMLAIAGMLFGLAAWGLKPDANGTNQLAQLIGTPQPTEVAGVLPLLRNEQDPWPVYPVPTELESLPDYPVPTPSVQPTPDEDGELPDVSEVTRIVIPALNVDTVVKYVPYDGLTWLISGLKQEVAWLGNTSWPGLSGNTALAGHVTLMDGGDGPFRNLPELAPGEVVYVYTQQRVYTYVVREQQVVPDGELSVLQSNGRSELTLITCTGWDKDLRIYLSRVVVYSDLTGSRPLENVVMGN